MATKNPKPFRKPIPEKRFRKKIRDRIYLDGDRAFLDDVTTLDENGTVTIARELSKDERDRLKKLAKEARKNRGAVRTGKLIVLAALVGTVLVFNYLYKDRLVERGAERMLTSLFRAEADLSCVTFRPFAGDVSFAALTVADANAPMTNLFELGAGRFAIDTWQLVSGKVIIDELAVSGLAFSTPRDRSGAIDGDVEDDASAERSSQPADPAPDAFSLESLGLPDTLDAETFVRREYESLETPRAAEALVQTGSGYVSRWQSTIADLTDAGVASAEEIQALATTDFTSIRSVERAIALVEQSSSVVTDATGYAERVEGAVQSATLEAQQIITRAAALPGLVESDYDRILARIPEIQAEGQEFLAGIVESYLRERLGSWYDRILTGYGYFTRLEELARERGRDGIRPGRRAGRLVDFTTLQFPAFELRQAYISTTGDRARELVVEAVSSNADLTGAPTMISYSDTGTTTGQPGFRLGAVVDQRTAAAAPLAITVASSDQRVALSEGLAALDLDRFAAEAGLEFSLLQNAAGTASGTIDLVTRNNTFAGSPEPGSIGELVRQVIVDADELTGSFGYTVSSAGVAFSGAATNLDEQISGVVQERINATLAEFEERVRTEVEALLGPELDRVSSALGGVADLKATADELLALATDREEAARALEERATAAVESLRTALEDEARERLEAARAEAERAAREAEEAARAEVEQAAREAEAAARAEAERAAREAESAVQNQAEELGERLRLPGF